MQVSYRQGVIRGQLDPITKEKDYLTVRENYVDINAEPTALVAVVSHKGKTYIIQEHKSFASAWGPLPENVTCLLYWNIDKSNGKVTRGYTTKIYSYGLLEPSNPEVGQHWFDISDDVMKVWDGNYWDEQIRVFAGIYHSNNPKPTYFDFASQSNDTKSTVAGYIYYDANLRGVKDPTDGTFLNTGDGLIVQAGSLNLPIKPESAVAYLTTAEAIPTKSLVYVNSDGKLALASSNSGNYAIGMTEDDAPIGTSTRLITNGIVYYEQWNFTEAQFGKRLFLGATGKFTFDETNQVIGVVLFKNAIVLSPSNSLTIEGGTIGVGPTGPVGATGPTGATGPAGSGGSGSSIIWGSWESTLDSMVIDPGVTTGFNIANLAVSDTTTKGMVAASSMSVLESPETDLALLSGGLYDSDYANAISPTEAGLYQIDLAFEYSVDTNWYSGPSSELVNTRIDIFLDNPMKTVIPFVIDVQNAGNNQNYIVQNSAICWLDRGTYQFFISASNKDSKIKTITINPWRKFTLVKLSSGLRKTISMYA